MSMDKGLILLLNKLQDAFANVGVQNPIDLPQIAVIGSQSSGKSSVLENLVGKDFLPRGSGIVTRRPLVLQLINRPATSTPASASQPAKEASAEGAEAAEGQDVMLKREDKNATSPDEWGEFLHLPGQKFHDFHKIRDEIVRDTDAKTGLTKVPVGDQPANIERQIRDMLHRYISKPNAVILAVTAANTDLANSDGLKMAREVDPDGVRTIGVLTKVDLMDAGTDVIDILAGRVIPLRLGYVPVVNRGQRDIDTGRAISSALEGERNFFDSHSSYSSRAQYCGTPFLAKKLNIILMHHIKATLPDVKAKIQQNLAKYEAELLSLGGPGSDNSANVVLSTITEFCNDYRTVIEGTSNEINPNELSGGARISFVFHELYNQGIKSIDPYDQVKDGDIRTLLYNSSGQTPSLFVGTTAFEVIVKQQIKRLEEPSVKCCQLIYAELIRILGQLLAKIQAFKRYPALQERFHAVVVAFLKKAMVPTTKLVSDMVAMQTSYINTIHPDFLNGHKAMAIASAKIEAAKAPPPTMHDPKTGKPMPIQSAINNGKDLDVDGRPEPSFFGSFFNKAGAGQRKKVVMEAPPAQIRPTTSPNDREAMETDVIKLLITSYFNIVKREMIDMVPKSITYTLVSYSKENLQKELLQELYKPDVLDELLKESDFIIQRRKECRKMVIGLTEADEIIAQAAP